MDPWEFFNWFATLGFVLCLIPQLSRTLRTRKADDISVRFLVLVLLASLSMGIYMLHVQNYVFAAAQVVNLAAWGTVLAIRLGLGVKPQPT